MITRVPAGDVGMHRPQQIKNILRWIEAEAFRPHPSLVSGHPGAGSELELEVELPQDRLDVVFRVDERVHAAVSPG